MRSTELPQNTLSTRYAMEMVKHFGLVENDRNPPPAI